jgi:5'-phosphate synthase pdxT subunit
MTISLTIGVLALQGAFSEHIQLLRRAFIIVNEEEGSVKVNWNYIEVRTPKELDECDALIVPGGESTTISLVAARSGLLEPLRSFVKYVHHSHP